MSETEQYKMPAPYTDQPDSDPQLTRRQLIKILAALGGAVTASSLMPEKWSRPQVGFGALPAHAQSTLCAPPYGIDHCTIDIIQNSVTELTTSAWITPACPGIQMALTIFISIEVDRQPERKPFTGFLTDSSGKATFTLEFSLPPGQASIYAMWGFFDPADGSDTCTTNVIHIDGGPTQ
jgi:hypothetical protein